MCITKTQYVNKLLSAYFIMLSKSTNISNYRGLHLDESGHYVVVIDIGDSKDHVVTLSDFLKVNIECLDDVIAFLNATEVYKSTYVEIKGKYDPKFGNVVLPKHNLLDGLRSLKSIANDKLIIIDDEVFVTPTAKDITKSLSDFSLESYTSNSAWYGEFVIDTKYFKFKGVIYLNELGYCITVNGVVPKDPKSNIDFTVYIKDSLFYNKWANEVKTMLYTTNVDTKLTIGEVALVGLP